MKSFLGYLKDKNKTIVEDLEGIDNPIGDIFGADDDYLFEAILNEHYVNLFKQDKRDEMDKVKDEVFEILQKSYEKAGGMAGINTPDDLIDDTDFWKLCRRNGKIVVAFCYSLKRGGRKTCYGGCDMTDEGKREMIKLMKADLDQSGRMFWAEVSGAVEHIYVDKLHCTMVPAELAKKLLSDKKFDKIDPDGYHYSRNIAGEQFKKVIVTTPELLKKLEQNGHV